MKAHGLDNDDAIFSGDSPNDDSMFSSFRQTVGVANVLPYGGKPDFNCATAICSIINNLGISNCIVRKFIRNNQQK